MFGDGQVVIEEVIMDENLVTTLGCSKVGEKCEYSTRIPKECCPGLTCEFSSYIGDGTCVLNVVTHAMTDQDMVA